MDKSDNSQYKSLCYNCLYKLQTNDIAHKVCPKCRMSINKDGLPLKGSSNSSWRKSDTGDDGVDEFINKNIALDQGFHYGKITRLRYGITEGNYGNWIVNPDKSFEFRYRNDDLVINRYKLTDSATGIKKTSSLNIIRNGLKEMLTNSQHTPSILYLELKETKLNYPTHIILLEEKFLKSRFGKNTGLNLLLNLIHTNNFFPVTAALHRKTIIYKVSDNYEKSISTSYLMPSSGLKVIERIPHNHLSLFNDEVELKKDIEQSLKFINIKAIHQYIPTLVNKSSLFFSENSKDEVGIINDQDGQYDDNMSQLSDISVSSVGEVTIKKVVPIIKKVIPNLEHMGISNQSKSESEPTPLVNKKRTILPIKDTRVIDDKSRISKEDTYDAKKAVLEHEDIGGKGTGKTTKSEKYKQMSKKGAYDAKKGVLEHMGIFVKGTEKTTKSEKYKQISSPDADSLSQESIGIDFLGDTTRSTYSDEILERTSDALDNERIYEEPSQERIGIDFLGDSNSQYTSDEDMLEGKQISEDGDKSVDDDWQAESIETISGEEEEKGVGIDFLGKEQNYKKQLDNSKNTNKLIVDFNDSGDEHDDEEVSFIKHDPKDIDSENDSKDISLKNTVSLIDLPDYATPLHDFWGEFNKTKISVRNSAKKHSKKDTIQYETDEESDITIDDDSDQEKEPEKKTKPRIRKKKKTEEKEPEKKTKPRIRKKKKTEEKEPEKKTKPKRSSKKKTEKNEPKKKPKTKRSSKKKTGGNTTSKKRDTKGRYISSSKKVSSNKTKSKSIKKTAKKTSSDKKRDSSGKYVSSKKNKRGGSRTRDTKGRFKPVR